MNMMNASKPKMNFCRGTIVKIDTKLLFNERDMRSDKAPWIYGTIQFLEDVCEPQRKGPGVFNGHLSIYILRATVFHTYVLC